MALRGSRKHGFASWLTGIALVGLTWRVLYALSTRHVPIASDGFRYHFGAIALVDGQGFVNALAVMLGQPSSPDTGHPPGWTLLLAIPSELGLRTWLEHGIFTALIGTATIVMVGLAGKAAFGSRVGLIAAAIAACYPNIFSYEREVLSEPLAMLAVATMIWLTYRFIAAPGAALAAALGATLGVLAMTKSDQLALAVLLVAPLILSRWNVALRQRSLWLVLAGALCVTIMAPWSIYLSLRYERPVLVSGAIGATMAAGNCAQTFHGELLGWYSFGCALSVKSTGDPFTDDNEARDRAVDYMADHKGRTAVVMAARIGRTFSVFRPFQQLRLEYSGGTRWVAWWGLLEFWALVPFATFGAILIRRQRRAVIWPLLVFPLLVVGTVLLTIGAIRYRAPAEIPLVILAAVGIDASAAALRRRLRPGNAALRPQMTDDAARTPVPSAPRCSGDGLGSPALDCT